MRTAILVLTVASAALAIPSGLHSKRQSAIDGAQALADLTQAFALDGSGKCLSACTPWLQSVENCGGATDFDQVADCVCGSQTLDLMANCGSCISSAASSDVTTFRGYCENGLAGLVGASAASTTSDASTSSVDSSTASTASPTSSASSAASSASSASSTAPTSSSASSAASGSAPAASATTAPFKSAGDGKASMNHLTSTALFVIIAAAAVLAH